MESDLNELSKPELVKLVKTLQSKIKSLRMQDSQPLTQAPREFEGLSGIRFASPSNESFDIKLIPETRPSESRSTNWTRRYQRTAAEMVNQLLLRQDPHLLTHVYMLLDDD